MKTIPAFLSCCFAFVLITIMATGCGQKEKTQTELAVGNWTLLRNRAYTLLITNPKGEWKSTVRIADATSKIVKSKGHAKGVWHIEDDQIIFSVTESDIEKIWQNNATLFYDIVLLTDTEMHLREESGRIGTWKKTKAQKASAAEQEIQLVIPMGPVVVNLNKNRSNDKDRYLCLNLNLILKELMPDQEPPPIHPRARDAAILFLSSLIQNDVKDFDRLKKQSSELTQIMNPYLDMMIKEIEIEHVIVANNIQKVEEFIIEHTMTEESSAQEGEEAGGDQGTAEKESAKG